MSVERQSEKDASGIRISPIGIKREGLQPLLYFNYMDIGLGAAG
jgi:hypothetical protein